MNIFWLGMAYNSSKINTTTTTTKVERKMSKKGYSFEKLVSGEYKFVSTSTNISIIIIINHWQQEINIKTLPVNLNVKVKFIREQKLVHRFAGENFVNSWLVTGDSSKLLWRGLIQRENFHYIC